MNTPGYLLTGMFLLFAADPVSVPRPAAIDFPVVAPVVVPQPVTPPAPQPDTTGVIADDLIYAVQSDQPFILLASPGNAVIVTRDQGPVRVRGIFAGGSSSVETRTLTGKYIAFVEPAPGATGKAELIAIPNGVTDEGKIMRTMVRIGKGPQPPPTPPGPTPVPAPTGFRVLIVYKADAGNTAQQLAVINSTQVREYLRRKCVKAADGTPEFRVWDVAITVTEKETKELRDLWTASKAALDNPPQVVIAVDGNAQVFPLPATEAELLTLLKSKGGE